MNRRLLSYAVTHLAGHRPNVHRASRRKDWQHATRTGVWALALWLLTTPAAAQEPGTIITVAGTGEAGFSGDGAAATEGQLHDPESVAVDAVGNLFIADVGNRRVRKVDAITGIITTIAGTGQQGSSGDGGPATEAQLSIPRGVAVDLAGNLYIADPGNITVRKVDSDGIITTVASGARPIGVLVDAVGNLFIAGGAIVRMMDTQGIISTVAGTERKTGFRGDGGPASDAQLDLPHQVSVDGSGILFIADSANHRLRKVDPQGIITTIAGSGPTGLGGGSFSGDGGPATEAQLSFAKGVVVDAAGNLFIGDTFNHRVRKVDTEGIITTVAGSRPTGSIFAGGFSGDGGPATEAQLNTPAGVALDAAGNLFIADHGNNRVRKVFGVAAPSPVSTLVTLETTAEVPQAFALEAYPNPFNGSTTIRFDLPESGEVELAVYNLTGQKVVTLADGPREPGTYTLRWDGRGDGGRELASGVYLYRLQVGRELLETRKLLLLR